MRWILLLLALCLWATPAAAQRMEWDPDTCWTCSDSWQHYGSTAVLNGTAIAVFPHWKPWQRVLLTGVLIGGVWEVGQADAARMSNTSGPGYGFGLKDLACDVAGAVSAELLFALGRKIF